MYVKKIKYFVAILLIFCVCLTTVRADVTIGAGPGGGHYASGQWRNFAYIPYGGPGVYVYRGYKIRFVYYDGSDGARTRGESAWQEITSFDVIAVDTKIESTYYSNLVKLHAQNNTRLGLLSSANVQWLGEQIAGVENRTTNETAIRDALEANDSARLKAIIKELGIDEAQMSKESEEEMKANAKGYRFIAEKLIVLANKGWLFANSRKEMAQVLPNNYSVTGFYPGLWQLRTLANGNGVFPGDIHTTRDDINVQSVGATWNYDNFKSYNIGAGLGIISIGKNPFSDHDYSYTAACASCENTNSDYLAYTIKDVDDWGAIMASGSSKFENVQGYFNDGSYSSGDSQDPMGDVYCREEFSVYFPNALSQIYVEPGRYFIMNPDDISGLSTTGASAIPNLKPYEVYRKRECRASVDLTQKENETYEQFQARMLAAKNTTLSNYEPDKKEDFASQMGKVWFRYNETYDESKYNMSEPEELDLYQVYKSNPLTNYSSKRENLSADDSQLTMENTVEYELPDDYYNYIRLRDGLSMMKAPNEAYRKIEIGNLPVSFENHGVKINATQYKAADIQFAYDLPDNAMLKKAASNPGYLATTKGDGGSGGDCISKETIMGEPTEGYSCKILTSVIPPNIDDKCDSPQDAQKLGVDWNSKRGYCCPVGTQYNEDTGTCDSGPGDKDDCKTEEDANRLGLSWNSKRGYCCPSGTKYNPSTGTCEGKPTTDDGECKTEEDANRLGVPWNPVAGMCCAAGTTYHPETGKCEGGNETDPVCPTTEDCPYGCCPSGECAPMPDGCPGFGGIDVIYRTIDLETPFPGQNAEKRNTGSNWCFYNIGSGAIDCSHNNKTADNYIIRYRNSRENGYKVYDNDHILYEVTLDSKTIRSIRNYNDSHKYDDFELNCVENGRYCFSKFLDNEVDISGKCDVNTKSGFISCDKDV